MSFAKADILPDEMNITYESGGNIIRRIRVEKRISIRSFAEEWDVSEKTVIAWENNKISPRFDLVMDIIQTYGFEVKITRKDVNNEKDRNRSRN